MQTKLIAGIKKGIYPLDIKIERNLFLHQGYTYSDDVYEYSIMRDDIPIGHLSWFLTDTKLELVEIHIHNVIDQAKANVADETCEGVGSAVIRTMLNLSAGLRRENFIIWHTRNYALLHLANKLSAGTQYVLLDRNGEHQDEIFNWPQLRDRVELLNCRFMYGGYYQNQFFSKTEDGVWRAHKNNSKYRLEFAANDRVDIYCADFLLPKLHVDIVGDVFDIVIPLQK